MGLDSCFCAEAKDQVAQSFCAIRRIGHRPPLSSQVPCPPQCRYPLASELVHHSKEFFTYCTGSNTVYWLEYRFEKSRESLPRHVVVEVG